VLDAAFGGVQFPIIVAAGGVAGGDVRNLTAGGSILRTNIQVDRVRRRVNPRRSALERLDVPGFRRVNESGLPTGLTISVISKFGRACSARFQKRIGTLLSAQ